MSWKYVNVYHELLNQQCLKTGPIANTPTGKEAKARAVDTVYHFDLSALFQTLAHIDLMTS